MSESTEKTWPKRIDMQISQDSNAPALAQLFPSLYLSEFTSQLKLYRKELQFSSIFKNNTKCETVLCNKASSEDELKTHLGALAQEWLYQALCTELIAVITDKKAHPNVTLTKIPAGKITIDDDNGELYNFWRRSRGSMDTTAATELDQKTAAKGDPKLNHWAYKVTLPMGQLSMYGDVYRLILTQSEKMGASLSDVARHMTLFVPPLALSSLLAKQIPLSSAYDMLKIAFPELKIIVLPELDQAKEQFAFLVCDDAAYGKPGYLVLKDGNPIKAFDPDDRITAIKYELAVPEHKLVITNPEQIAVLEGI